MKFMYNLYDYKSCFQRSSLLLKNAIDMKEEVGVRRIYETEIDIEEVSFQLFSLNNFNYLQELYLNKISTLLQNRKISCTDRETLTRLGLWDIVFDESKHTYIKTNFSPWFKDIIPNLKLQDRQTKPWLSNRKELEDELKKLGITKNDLNLNVSDKPILLDVINNPVDRVS